MVVTIPVQCPHCESEFQLSPDLVGKTMRCPIPDCREVFEVRAAGRPTEPTPEPPTPEPVAVAEAVADAPAAGLVSDFVPVLEVEAAGPAPLPYARVEP